MGSPDFFQYVGVGPECRRLTAWAGRPCYRMVLIAAVALAGCTHTDHKGQPEKSESPKVAHLGSGFSTPPKAYKDDERRLLYAQIVEDYDPEVYEESAILEGAPYKYFLHGCAENNQDALRKQANDKLSFEELMAQPGSHRGEIVTVARGVVLEASKVELPAEFGLPGYSVMLAVLVDSARDVWALRVLLPPGSNVYERVRKGIDKDALQVCRACGYFMKLYARDTNVEGEPPWRRPLLVCPEIEFAKFADPRPYKEELIETGADKYLPSHRHPAPDAEERLVVEVSGSKSGSYQVQVGGKSADGATVKNAIAEAVAGLRKRLPAEQAQQPAAVIFMQGNAPKAGLDGALAALRAAGVQRLAIKRETGVSVTAK